MIGRRTFVQMVFAGGLASSVPFRSDAAESTLEQLVRQGDFGGAAKVLQREVDARPLDRDARLALGKLQFGSSDFAAASEAFELVERRGGLKDDFGVVNLGGVLALGSDDLTIGSDFSDSAAWLHLATLRRGKKSTLAAGAPESIRSVLLGTLTVPEYVEIRGQYLTEVLDDVAARYGEAEGVATSVAASKRRLDAALTCAANFALAEQFLGGDDGDKARSAFSAAIKTEADRLIEFHIAKAELERLG